MKEGPHEPLLGAGGQTIWVTLTSELGNTDAQLLLKVKL